MARVGPLRAKGGRVAGRRFGTRPRRLLAAGLAATLAWTSGAFLQETNEARPNVSVVEGTEAFDGRIARVTPLQGEVTVPNGRANLAEGVKFSRIEVAEAAHQSVRIHLAWQNPFGFSRDTHTNGWQIRFGLYYPVRQGGAGCTPVERDDNGAVDLVLTAAEDESFSDGVDQAFCAYRDLGATGPGAVTSGPHQGTQLLASNYLSGTLRPSVDQTNATECSTSGESACLPTGLGTDHRVYFVVGSLLNPAGNVPKGSVGDLEPLQLHTFVRRIGGVV